jgi:hypothetical protein
MTASGVETYTALNIRVKARCGAQEVRAMGSFLSILIVPVRAMFVLMTIASVSVIGLTTSHRSEKPFDPFAIYRDILPGRPRDAVLQYGFNCQYDTIHSFHDTCLLTPEKGIFSQIEASFVSDTGKISGLVFRPREGMLTVGDLVLLWGKPEVAIYSGTVKLRWRGIHVITIPQVYRGYFSYWLPIRYVAFEPGE